MAELTEPLPEAENSHGSATGTRPGEPGAGTPFPRGRSGNPGGRPKGLARKVREVLGDDDGETLARIAAGITTGYALYVHPETGERTYEKVSVPDRMGALKFLAERGWGKPAEFVPIDSGDPLEMGEEEAREIAVSFEKRLDEVSERRRKREATAAAG